MLIGLFPAFAALTRAGATSEFLVRPLLPFDGLRQPISPARRVRFSSCKAKPCLGQAGAPAIHASPYFTGYWPGEVSHWLMRTAVSA